MTDPDDKPESKRVINGQIMRWLHTGNRESMRFLLQVLGYQTCPQCDYVDDHCHCVRVK